MADLETPGTKGRRRPSVFLTIILIIGLVGAFAVLLHARMRMETVLENRIDRLLAAYSPVVDVAYRDVDVGFFGRSIRISGIRIRPIGAAEPFRIGRLVVHRFDHRHAVPRYLSVSAESVAIPRVDTYLGKWLPGQGFSGTGIESADLFLDAAYDPEARRFNMQRFSADVRDRGTLSLAAGIGNISPENMAVYLVMPYSILFEGMSVVYSDKSLVSRWLERAAAREGMTPEAYARRLNRWIGERAIRARQNRRPAVAEALEAVMAFLERPQTLIIEARPDHPVPFGRLMRVSTFEEAVELLDLHIMANRYQ